MAQDSKLSSIGESLIIIVEARYSGRVTLLGYDEELLGVTEDRTVQRFFRVSTDSVLYTDWLELTPENIASVYEIVNYILLIEVKYVRTGTDATGEIEFLNIEFAGTSNDIDFLTSSIRSSIFVNVAETKDAIDIETNLFKKLYYRGIVPRYISRGDNRNKNEDGDYAVLFSSIAKFFSLFISFFKTFENSVSNKDVLREYLNSNGIIFNESNVTLEDLQYLADNTFDEMRKRGTEMIFKRKGFVLPSGKVVQIDGEFLRLLRNIAGMELIYEQIEPHKQGWNMGNSSPLWKGTSESVYLNKTKEMTQDFVDIDNFITEATGGSSISIETLGDRKCLKLVGGSEVWNMGIGRNDVETTPEVSDFLIPIDTKMDYEITFQFLIETSEEFSGKFLRFGVEGFNSLKSKVNDAFIKQDGSEISELFIEHDTALFAAGVWIKVRGIIHAYSTELKDDQTTNVGQGNNLYFYNKFINYILPKIQFYSLEGAYDLTYYIWDYKIRPLVRGKNILTLRGENSVNANSLGFLGLKNMFYVYAKNANNNLSEDEIIEMVEKFLLNYNTVNQFVFLK